MEVILDDYMKEMWDPGSYGFSPLRMKLDNQSTVDPSPASLVTRVKQ